MSSQWTEEDPGAGSTGSVKSLATMLGKAAGQLDSGQTDIQQSLGVFPDGWSGLAANAAKSRIEELKTQVGALASAAESVKKALKGYAEEVDEIKPLANDQVFLRDAAEKREKDLRASLVVVADHVKRREAEAELKEATAAKEAAVASLSRLAKRRQAAEDAALSSVRSAIAENWDISPGDWPNERSFEQQASYDYEIRNKLGVTTDQYTAKELMDLFKEHPGEIFPFPVKGSSKRFEDGALFELSETLKVVDWAVETGNVVVTTTDTSIKFTVVSDGYFDGPGSTIEFSVVEDDGMFYLKQVADARQAQAAMIPFVYLGANITWEEQAYNFRKVILEHAKK